MAIKTSITNSQPNLTQIIPVITKLIIGEICHQVTFSYGDELRLDFGEMSAYSHPSLAHLCKGSWRLGTRATPWILKQKDRLLISSSQLTTEEEINAVKTVLRQLENKKLSDFVIDSQKISLTLFFENNYQLILEPDLQDDSGIAYWELFMPTDQVLTVGPGLFWDCKSIHERY